MSNQAFGSAGLTWAEHTETWAENSGTWANPFLPIANQAKNSSSMTNQTKN